MLALYPERRLLIESHTDERGTDAENVALSARQAEALRRFLSMSGVDPSRLETAHYGEQRPLCTEHNESCWRVNRRTEVSWIEPPDGD